MRSGSCHPRRGAGRSFTLTELLVAIGIIAVLTTLTVFSVKGISKSARLSSATNTIVAVLGNARALAMKNNRPVLVAFRAKWDPKDAQQRQVTELVIAEWSGSSDLALVFGELVVNDRFNVVPGQISRMLPAGIKVAGPWYDHTTTAEFHDETWITQSEFRAMASNEAAGRQFCIMYAPDGSVTTRNPVGDASDTYVDYNGNGLRTLTFPASAFSPDTGDFWEYDHPDDENNLNPVPFLAVYDDDEARKAFDVSTWTDAIAMRADLTTFITKNADRIHFNRYSGVAMTTRGEGG